VSLSRGKAYTLILPVEKLAQSGIDTFWKLESLQVIWHLQMNV
jgi:hypothetical protein